MDGVIDYDHDNTKSSDRGRSGGDPESEAAGGLQPCEGWDDPIGPGGPADSDHERGAGRLPTRRRLSYREVIVVYMRDDGLCGICQQPVDAESVEIDHIIPFARGGSDHISNLQLAHGRCNRVKHARMEEPASRDYIPGSLRPVASDDDPTLTVQEAAAVLGVEASVIRRRLIAGRMRGHKVNPRLWLISKREVNRWKERGMLPRGRRPGGTP
jgi:5-methylcytosine-specific restriction protein A